MNWIDCMNNVIDYIEDHLTGEIDETIISQKACCSIYNFQRVFTFLHDQSLYEYIRSRRLSLAGQELCHSKARIIDIAVRYGYDSQEAFTRAFTKFHGFPPTAARRNSSRLRSCERAAIPTSFERGGSEKTMDTKQALLTRREPEHVFRRGGKGPWTLLYSVSLWSYLEFMGQNFDPGLAYTLLVTLCGEANLPACSLPGAEGMAKALDTLGVDYQVFSTDKIETNYLDEDSVKRKIVESISVHKRPVIICNQEQICFGGAIIGYEDGGDTLINWGFYPFDDRDVPEPILTPCREWYGHTQHVIIVGERRRGPVDLKDIYISGAKNAAGLVTGRQGLILEDFYHEWERFLRLTKDEAFGEIRRTGKVPGTWQTRMEDEMSDKDVLAKLKEIVEPLWCDLAERRFFGNQFLRQAKAHLPESLHYLLDQASGAYRRIHDGMYEYTKLVDLVPGVDGMNLTKLFDPGTREQMCAIVHACRNWDNEATAALEELARQLD